jgi:hypothetical protein
MIDAVVSSSDLLQINIGSTQTPYVNPSALSSGQVRYNPSTTKLEVLDGGSNSWHELPGQFASIGFGFEVEETIKWAREQMRKEHEWRKLAEKNQGMKTAFENYQQAKGNLEILTQLTKEFKND